MQQRLLALRYLVSTLAVSIALGLVGFAQTTSPTAPKPTMTAAAANMPMDAKAMMVAEWTRAKDYTKEYLDAMPEDGLSFKPTPDHPQLRRTDASFGQC